MQNKSSFSNTVFSLRGSGGSKSTNGTGNCLKKCSLAFINLNIFKDKSGTPKQKSDWEDDKQSNQNVDPPGEKNQEPKKYPKPKGKEEP